MSYQGSSHERKLPVHGFVLAGGKSSRMGRDKALLPFRGRPLVEIAVAKLQGFCSAVSIAGNRRDLSGFAPVAPEARMDCGPAAGIEAGLRACAEPWALFVPVDVPLVPGTFLRRWANEALRVQMSVSYLSILSLGKQPAFCMLQRERQTAVSRRIDQGERSLERLLNSAASDDGVSSWMYDERELYGGSADNGDRAPEDAILARWFANVNTPEDLLTAELVSE